MADTNYSNKILEASGIHIVSAPAAEPTVVGRVIYPKDKDGFRVSYDPNAFEQIIIRNNFDVVGAMYGDGKRHGNNTSTMINTTAKIPNVKKVQARLIKDLSKLFGYPTRVELKPMKRNSE